MARNGAILGLGGSLADRDEYVSLSILSLTAFGVTHLPPCTQLCRQLLLQHAARLNKETAIEISACFGRSGSAVANRRSALATHCSASFYATRHRKIPMERQRQGLGRSCRSHAHCRPG